MKKKRTIPVAEEKVTLGPVSNKAPSRVISSVKGPLRPYQATVMDFFQKNAFGWDLRPNTGKVQYDQALLVTH